MTTREPARWPTAEAAPLAGDLEAVDAVTRVLVRALRAFADAGKPQDAGRLAGQGWAALRETHPRQAEHLSGIMHHIARVQTRMETPAPQHQ